MHVCSRTSVRVVAIVAMTLLCQVAPTGSFRAGGLLGGNLAEAKKSDRKKSSSDDDKKDDKKSKKQREIERHMFTAQYFLLQENDLVAAAKEYKKVLSLDKGHLDAGLGLAYIQLRDKKAKQAVKMLEKLAKQKPKDGRIWHALGQASVQLGDHDAAVAAYEKALDNDKFDAEARWLVFDSLATRYREGKKELKKPLEQAIANYLLYVGLHNGIRYKVVERTRVEISGDAMALTIYDADAAYNTAFTESGLGEINEAMARARSGYEECLRSQPENQRCHYGLGLVYSSVKASDQYNRDKARQEFGKADKLPEAHIELAKLARFDDDLKGAQQDLTRALSLDKNNQRAMVELGIVYKLAGRNQDAVDTLARAYRANRFAPDAARALAELTKIEPEHEIVKENSMWGLPPGDVFTADRFKAAIKMFEEALGGVEGSSPEQTALETMLSRLREAADIDSSADIKIGILKTEIPNAVALPNGQIYFTRGLLDYVAKQWPDRPINADNAVVAHVLAHELAHVLRQHTLQSSVFQEAMRNASEFINPAILTHVTRMHEIEADRVGITLAFLAGYHPRGGIEIMEARGRIEEVPANLDHPTFDERVSYLEEYWSNDVKYAFVSFSLGVGEIGDGDRELAKGKNANEAASHYRKALEHFARFRDTIKPTKNVLNNMAVAHARLGLFSLGKGDSPLHRWQTELSVERDSALAYVAVAKGKAAPGGGTRGARKDDIPKDLREAVSLFKEALERDAHYSRARENLAAAYIAMGQLDKAKSELDRIKGRGPGAARAAMMRGILYAESKKYKEAIAELRTAMQDPALQNAGTYNLARLYVLAGDKAKAKELYQRYRKAVPRGPWSDAAKRELGKL